MKRTGKIGLSIAAIVLLSVPSVWACCGGALAAPPCEMEAMADMGMKKVSKASPCHGADPRMSGDCCDLRPLPDPMPTRLFDLERLLVVDETVAPLAAGSARSIEPVARSVPPQAARLHDLGRYTLFSAWLL